MANYTYPHVEDYIEIIAGYREINGKTNYNIFTVATPVISLARYDMKIVPNLAEQTLGNRGYTDKQAKLAADLVLKYERQMAKLNIDVTPVRTPAFRLPIRVIDRQCRVWVEDDIIKLKFPYDPDMINTIRDVSKMSNGALKFNRDSKVYNADLTEWNLNWVYSFAQANKFEIDNTIHNLMELVLTVEKNPYAIELVYTESELLNIVNASGPLLEYINSTLGGFALENILRLIDYAPILGYTVHADIANDITRNLGSRFWTLSTNRALKVDTAITTDVVKDIVDYATLTNRFPIFIYEPDLSGRLLAEIIRVLPGPKVNLDNKLMDNVIDKNTKVVYTSKIPRQQFNHIPLLISSAGMLFGGDRQMWIQTAEKVVYFSKDVYNTVANKGIAVCKLD